MTTKALLKTMNAPLVESRIDPVLSGSGARIYNWISDTFRHGA